MSSALNLLGGLRWLTRSSTLRLSVLLSVLFAAGMTVAIFIALTLGEQAVLRRVDTSLASLAASVEADDGPADTFAVVVRPLEYASDLPAEMRQAARRTPQTVDLSQDFRQSETWRVVLANDEEGEPVLVAVPLEDTEEALDLLSGVLWSTASVVLGLSLLLGLGAGLLAQRRLVRINGVLKDLAGGDLKARTDTTKVRDDLDDLAHQLDLTADELERLVEQTRNLSASLAHDLRTPLARLRARIETLPDSDERGAALEEAERLAGVFDAIMRVARIEATQGTDGFETVDLSELATEVSSIFGPVVEDAGKQLDLDLQAPDKVEMDRGMVIQALANLLQNAIVHGGPKITLFARDASIGVVDNGEGVDPSQFDEIIKPMVRLDAARASEGSGLGLALVRAVAQRHHADLGLSENDPKGLRVTLNFTHM